MPITTVAAIIKNDEGKILLTRRNVEPFKGQWCLPGGHIDKYETVKDAVIREMKEETGLEIDPKFFSYSDEIITELDIHAVVILFTGYGFGKISIQESEVSDIGWFALDEANSLSLAFGHNKMLIAYAKKISSKETQTEMLAEYSALRSEILKRMDMRQQMLTFTLVIAGTILSFGVQDEVSPMVLLLYPILAMFLATAWTQSDTRIWDIAEYIKNHIETNLSGINWEHYVHDKNKTRKVRILELTATGVFLTTEVLTVLLAFPRLRFSIEEILLLAFAGLAFVLTFITLQRRSQAMKKTSKISK
jgi:8-oxo-dGTP diphosphatase